MKINLNQFIEAFKTLPKGVTEAEVNAVFTEELSLTVENGRNTAAESASVTKYYIRASGEKTGSVYTEKLDEDPTSLILKAYHNSIPVDGGFFAPLNNKKESLRLLRGSSKEGREEMLSFIFNLEEEIKKDSRVNRLFSCGIRKTIYACRTANSKGMDNYMENTYFLISINAEIGVMDISFTYSALNIADFSIPDILNKLIAEAFYGELPSGLAPYRLPLGKYRTFLSNRVVRNILLTAWQEFSGEKMLSGNTIFKNEKGASVGSPCLNIIDAPSHELTGHVFELDCEGTLCYKKHIVKDGLLETPLHSLPSAKNSTQLPTGNAGRAALLTGSIPINIITVPSNIYIEKGDADPLALLDGLDEGVYLTYSLDFFHSINITSGEFSIPCGGYYYKKGKPVATLSQITMAGNLRDLFNNIECVCNDLMFSEFIYKNYCYGAPSIVVKDILLGC